MNYTSSAIVHYDLQWIREEKALFSEALAIISSRLNIDPDSVFMGGYSEGGFHTSFLGERVLDRLAGLIILGAGRHAVDHYSISKRRGIRGKPIFIGVGQYDHQNPHAKNTAQFYTRCEADVTFEEWPGVGHGINTPEFPSKMLLNWLENICATKR